MPPGSHLLARREILRAAGGVALLAAAPRVVSAGNTLPEREIPGTREKLPVIGLGSTKSVREIPDAGVARLREVVTVLLEHGGRVIDTAPRTADIDAPFGEFLARSEFDDRLFVAAKVNATGPDAGLAQFRATQRYFGRREIDLLQIESLTDLEGNWETLVDLKSNGEVRYIGVTVAHESLYAALEQFMRSMRPDFVQLNYSVIEHSAEERLLPLADELGVAVLVNGPFMNGEYFERVRGHELPEWARSAGCRSWADLTLKYALSHPAVTCVLTETTSPEHMRENLEAAIGPLPDEAIRERMRELARTMLGA